MAKQTLRKVLGPNIPDYLYILDPSGVYCGFRRVGGKLKKKSLKTTDLSTAKRKLKDWLQSLEDRKGGEICLKDLCDTFLSTKVDRKPKTIISYKRAIKLLYATFGEKTPVHKIEPSELAKMLSEAAAKYAGSTSNHISIDTAAIFEIAVNDKKLKENPVKLVPKNIRIKKLRPKTTQALTPEQYRQMIAYIKNKERNKNKKESLRLVQFITLAACGVAEAVNIDWQHVIWDEGHIEVVRVKTGEPFNIPLFTWLRPFMEEMWIEDGKPTKGKIFKIKSCHKVIAITCKALGFPRITPRSLRKLGIRTQIRAGFRAEEIAKHQGHMNDGGYLISTVYANVFAENDKDYLKERQATLQPPDDQRL